MLSKACFVNGSDDFMKVFKSIEPRSRLRKDIENAIEVLKRNPVSGDKVEKRLWPDKYKRKYQINNLFRYRLSDGWRLTYTIASDKRVTISTILDALDHATYDKLFGYHSS